MGEGRGIYSVAMFHVGAKSALLRHFLCSCTKKRHPSVPLLLLSKPDPLALGSGLVLGADLKAGIYTVGIPHVGASNMTLAPIFFMPAHEIQLPAFLPRTMPERFCRF